MPEPRSLIFGPFRLDLRDERLWRGLEVLPLQPKPFAVLRCLVSQAGQLVTRETLLEAIWPETPVGEGVLTAAVRHLRRVLADPVRTPQLIETVHRRGYRFIAPVAVAAPPPREPWTMGISPPDNPLLPPLPASLSDVITSWPGCTNGSTWRCRAGGRWGSSPGSLASARLL
jgi:DNA-binding winged helix-turn-helix (wHTH) protein